MEYNKQQFQKTNDKRVLHKVRKHWVVVSLALLMAIGGKAVVSHTSAHADVSSQSINNNNVIKEQLNQKLVQAQNNQPQGQTAQNSQTNSNQSQSQLSHTSSTGLDSAQIIHQAQLLHQQIMQHADVNNSNVSINPDKARQYSPTATSRSAESISNGSVTQSNQRSPQLSVKEPHRRLLGADDVRTGTLEGINYRYDVTKQSLELTSGTWTALAGNAFSQLSQNTNIMDNRSDEKFEFFINDPIFGGNQSFNPYQTNNPVLKSVIIDKGVIIPCKVSDMFVGDTALQSLTLGNNTNNGSDFISNGDSGNANNCIFQNDPNLRKITITSPNTKFYNGISPSLKPNANCFYEKDGSSYKLHDFTTGAVGTYIAPALFPKGTILTGDFKGLHYKLNPYNQSIEFTGGSFVGVNNEYSAGPEVINSPILSSSPDNNESNNFIKSVIFDDDINTDNFSLSDIFTSDTNLQSVKFGSSFDEIGITGETFPITPLFTHCPKLRSVTFDKLYQSPSYPLFDQYSLPSSVTITSPDTKIDEDAYYYKVGNNQYQNIDLSKGGYAGTVYNINVLPSNAIYTGNYDGLDYRYNRANQSLVFTSGKLDVSDLSNFINNLRFGSGWPSEAGTYIPPKIKSVTFDNGLDMSKANNLSKMFEYDTPLQSVDFGDSFSTNNINTLGGMFNNDINLKHVNFSDFNTSKVTDMSGMFMGDTQLSDLDLSHFNVNNVADARAMFLNDSRLQHLQLNDSFNNIGTNTNDYNSGAFIVRTNSNVSDMFANDSSLNLNLSNWKFSSDIPANMFFGVNSVTLPSNVSVESSDLNGAETIFSIPKDRQLRKRLIDELTNKESYTNDSSEPNAICLINNGSMQMEENGTYLLPGPFIHDLETDGSDFTSVSNYTNAQILFESPMNVGMTLGVTLPSDLNSSYFTPKYVRPWTPEFYQGGTTKPTNLADGNPHPGTWFSSPEVQDTVRYMYKNRVISSNFKPRGVPGSVNKINWNNSSYTQMPANWQIAGDGTQNFKFDGKTNDVDIMPNQVTDTIIYKNGNNYEGTGKFTGNTIKAQNADNQSFTINSNSEPNGINPNYHVSGNNAFNYDGGNYTVQVSPNVVTNHLNFIWNNTSKGGYNVSGTYGTSKVIDTTDLPGWNVNNVQNNQGSDGNHSFRFNSNGTVVNVDLIPARDTDYITYIYNGPNGKGSVNSSNHIFTGNDYRTGVNGGFTVGTNPEGLPVNYRVSDANQYIPYDNGTHVVNVKPRFQIDDVKYHDIYNNDGIGDPSYADKYVSDTGYYQSNGGHPIYNVTNNDVPSGFALVDSTGKIINPSQDNFNLDDGSHTLDVAPVYDGLTYDYDKNNKSVTFVNGTLNWNGNSNVPFIGSGHGPSQLQNATSVTFGNGVNVSGLTSTHQMFRGDGALQHLNLGNVFDTQNVNDMSEMFQSDHALRDLNLGTNFNTSNVINMNSMFKSDGNLKDVDSPSEINLSGLNVSKVTNLSNLFQNDGSINTMDLSGWNLAGNLNSLSYLFSGDSALQTLNLSNWSTNYRGTGHNFDGDNALNKLTLNAGLNLANASDNFGSRFFNNNVNSDGFWSTNDIKQGKQSSSNFYAAKPVNVNFISSGTNVKSYGNAIGTAINPDDDYHGNVLNNVKNQIASVGIQTPTGYSLDSNNPYTIQNQSSNSPYVNVNVDPLKVTVPVQFINNANGHNDVIYSYTTPVVAMGNTVNINTTLPRGYSWNQPTPSNQLKVVIGQGSGQISNNSGRTNPYKLYVKGNQITIPVHYINQENDLAATDYITTHVDSDVTWPTQANMKPGLTLDPNQQIKSHVVGTYTNNGDDNYLNNNSNTQDVHLDPKRNGYTNVHYMNVSAAATHIMAAVTTVMKGLNKTYSDVIRIPVEGHVDDTYTISDSDFNVPEGYSLNTPADTYTVKLTAPGKKASDPGQYQWSQTNNPWDRKNNRPEIVYTADNAGAINVRYLNQHNQEVGHESTLTGKVGDTDNLDQVSVPAGYNYDANRTKHSQITFTNSPQDFTVYVIGKNVTNIPVQYSAPGLQSSSVADGTVSGRVGDTVTLPVNHLPVGYAVSSATGQLNANHHNGNLNYVIQPSNSTQYVDLTSREFTVPIKFDDVNSSTDNVAPVDYSKQGTLTSSINLPSAPRYYRYASGQPTRYQFNSSQINPQDSDQMNLDIIKVEGLPTTTKVSYVDPNKNVISSYVVNGQMGDPTSLRPAPQGYELDSDNPKYTPLPSDVSNGQVGPIQMNDYIVPIHAQYHRGIQKALQIKYENSDGTVQNTSTKDIVFGGYTGDQFTFNPQNLNVPAGYTLVTNDLDQAHINADGSATWQTDHKHDNPTIVFKADKLNDNLHITQIEELPNHMVIGTKVLDYPVSGDVGQSYSVSANKIAAPQNYHLANNIQTMQGQITSAGITNNNRMLDYIKDSANDIDVHYRIHGHNSDISSYDYNKNNYSDAYIGEKINGFDHIPEGYVLNTNNTSPDIQFTFSPNSEDRTVYVEPFTSKDSVPVNVILQDNNGHPINDPDVPVLSSTNGHMIKGYRVIVPVNAKGDDDEFTITPSDMHLRPYIKGFTPYQNSDIKGVQKTKGPDITSSNKDTFVYRADTDSANAGSLTVEYMNQNGQLINNETNHQTSYVVPNGYRDRNVSDVTKLAGVPKGYQLLNTDKKNYVFNGTNQIALLFVKGNVFNDKVHVFKVEEDPNDRTSKTVSDYYDIPNAQVGNDYIINAEDYIPSGYSEDTTNDADQPVTFTVQQDGTLNNNASVKFYYRSNADAYLNDLKNIIVNYRAHYNNGFSRQVSDNRLVNHGIINPSQIPDVYNGQMVSDVTKYVPVPSGYRLDTNPQQDLQAMVSNKLEPKVTLNVTPTVSNGHDSDKSDNAQPIFMAFENDQGQILDENGQIIGNNGKVSPDNVQRELRLDGAMGATVNPLSTYSVPSGYQLTVNQIPNYQISNQVQHKLIAVHPSSDSTLIYHLTVKTLTPSDKPLNTVHSDVKIPVPINQTVAVKPSAYNPDTTHYQFDSGASSNGGNISVTNTNLRLNQNSGTLVYKAEPNNDVGSITVNYYDGSRFINRGFVSGQYAQQPITVNDIANAVKPAPGYTVNANQNHTYIIGNSGNQNVDIYVHGQSSTPGSVSDVVTVNLIKEDNYGNKIGSDVVHYAIDREIGDDYTIDPNEFTPKGFKLDTNHTGNDDPVKGIVQDHSLSQANATFYYQATQQTGPIYVKYINQTGQQVGQLHTLNGGYGHTIDNIADHNDGGIDVPKGYRLVSNLNQMTRYTFGLNSQYVDLFIVGQPVTNHYTVKVIKNNGNDVQTNQIITRTYQGKVGDLINVDPTNYLPSNYQIGSQDHNQVLTASINGQTTPAAVTFIYNELPVVGHVIYKNDTTKGIVGQQPVVGTAGSNMSGFYNDYETYLPYGYKYDHIDRQNNQTLENGDRYVIYLAPLSVKTDTKPTKNLLNYINVEYRDAENGKVISTIRVAGDNKASFSSNEYVNNLPKGYKSGRLDKNSAKPTRFESDIVPDVIIDMNKDSIITNSNVTDTIKYVDLSGHVVGNRNISGSVGNSINWIQYTGYVPSGYVYDYMGNHETNLTGRTDVVYVQSDTPQIQYGTVNINYVDTSDNKLLMTNPIYGIAGSAFDLSQYERDLPSYYDANGNIKNYLFNHAVGNVKFFNTGNQTLTVAVNKAPKSEPMFGEVIVKYVDSSTDQQVDSPITISGKVNDIFDPSAFENNLPENYGFVSASNPIYNFATTPQTMIVNVKKDA